MDEAPDISMPIALQPLVTLQQSTLQKSLLGAPNFWWVQVMGRLKPGVTAAQVRGNLAGIFQHSARAQFDAFLSERSPQERALFSPKDPSAIPELLVDSGSRGMDDVSTEDFRAVTILAAVVAIVLLIVCANVANLQLSRATARRMELSIRLALGATRGALVRQLLIESLLLSCIGGALGLVIGTLGTIDPAARTDAGIAARLARARVRARPHHGDRASLRHRTGTPRDSNSRQRCSPGKRRGRSFAHAHRSANRWSSSR